LVCAAPYRGPVGITEFFLNMKLDGNDFF